MLETLSEYSNLVNVALLVTILGVLVRLVRLSNAVLKEKFEAQLATKNIEHAQLQQAIDGKAGETALLARERDAVRAERDLARTQSEEWRAQAESLGEELGALRQQSARDQVKSHLDSESEKAPLNGDETREVEALRAGAAQATYLTQLLAHQLGASVASLRHRVEYLRKGPWKPPKKIRSYIESIDDEVGRLAFLLRAIKTDDTTFQEAQWRSVEELVLSAVKTLASFAAKKQVRVSVTTTNCSNARVESRVEQALLNTLRNAIAASGPRATVVVKAWTEQTRAFISVRDFGPGIPEAEREAVFQPGYVGRSRQETRELGAGFGLWISRKLMSASGGDIEIRSTANPTEIFLTAPLERAEQ